MVSRRVSQALRRAQEAKSLLRIDRTPRFADRVDGIPLRVGRQWTLLAQTADGGYFDGYVALRLRDISTVALDETFAREFVTRQAEWPPSLSFDIDLDSASSVLEGLVRQGRLLGIRKENERPATWVGTPDELTSRHIYLNEIRPDATWHARPLGYRLRSITMAEVGTRYLIGLSAVAGAGPASSTSSRSGGST